MRAQARRTCKRLFLAGLVAVAALAGCGVPAGIVLIPTVTPQATAGPPTVVLLPASAEFTVTPAPATHTVEPSPLPPSATPAASLPVATASATRAPSATVGPTPEAEAHLRQVPLPVLMYHYVEPWPPGPGELRQGLTVRPEDFAAQMAYLYDHGYVTVSLYDLVDALAVGRPLPAKAVVITFDDGYRTLMDFAVPTMQQYGYTGTVFVLTQLMDEDFPQYLTWEQAESLYAQGWKVEPHTKTHEQLAGRGWDFQLYQMLGSLQTVEAHIGRAPRFFAYPSGKYDELSVQMAQELHLWGAVTTNYARVHMLSSLYTLGRVRVSGTGTLEEFRAGLGDYP